MNQSKIHRTIGLVMLLPLLAWASTGVVFLTKPGYDGAYERLPIKTYELDTQIAIAAQKGWEEIRVVQSILGLHVLVKQNGSYRQIDPAGLSPLDAPDEEQVKKLVADAITINPDRYGVVERVEGSKVVTSTGISVELNWDEMMLSQRGFDRTVIETLYKIHYLQWTKWEGFNLVLGVLGLSCLLGLTLLGLGSYLSRGRQTD